MNDLITQQSTDLATDIGVTDEVSWTAPANMDFDTFQRIGNTFQQIRQSLNFWYGDWLVAGEERFGEAAYQAVSETGKSYETILKLKAVSFRVRKEIRQKTLGWTSHFYCAYIPVEQRGPLLEIAANIGLSSRELKDVVKLDDDTRHEFMLAVQHYTDEQGPMSRDTFFSLLNRFRLGDVEKEEVDDDKDEDSDDDGDDDEQEDTAEEVTYDDLLDFWENTGVPLTSCGTYSATWEGLAVRAAVDSKGKPQLVWEKMT